MEKKVALWKKSSSWRTLKNAFKISYPKPHKLEPVAITSVTYQSGILYPNSGHLNVTWAETVQGAKGYNLRLVSAEPPYNIVDKFSNIHVDIGTATQANIQLFPNALPEGNYRIQVQTQGNQQQYTNSEWVTSSQSVTQLAKPLMRSRDVYKSTRSINIRIWHGIELTDIDPAYRHHLAFYTSDVRQIHDFFISDGSSRSWQETFHIDLTPESPNTWIVSLMRIGLDNQTVPGLQVKPMHELSGYAHVTGSYKLCTVAYAENSDGRWGIKILFDHDFLTTPNY